MNEELKAPTALTEDPGLVPQHPHSATLWPLRAHISKNELDFIEM